MGQVIALKPRPVLKQQPAPIEEVDPDHWLLRLDQADARGIVFGRVESIKQNIAKLDVTGIDTAGYSQRLEALRGRLSIFNIFCSAPQEPAGCALVSRNQMRHYEELTSDLQGLVEELAIALAPYTNLVLFPGAAKSAEG